MNFSLLQALLAVIFTGVSLAYDANAQEVLSKQVSVRFENQDLRKVLKSIENQTNIRFAFRPSEIPVDSKITVIALNESLGEVLDKLVKPLRLQYEVLGRQIVLRPVVETSVGRESSMHTEAAITFSPIIDQVITGVVTDENAQALPGVSVVLKGTNRGTTTDASGKYQLSVSEDTYGKGVLVFSFVGYITVEQGINKRTTVSVSLRIDDKTLNEVVVVGYGSQQKKDVVGSIASVKADELNLTPNANLAQGIQGRMAGVQVTQNSGAPGGNVSIRIRGINSINGSSEPLYVIDGVQFGAGSSDANAPSPLSQINPNDIESIDVLKDASATAIYGARGANGVVLITTKRGKQGRSVVSYEGYYGVQSVTKTLDLLNATQFAQLENEVFRRSVYSDAEIATLGEGTDWQQLIFREAPIQNHQLSLASGSEKTQLSLSANYFNQDGILLNSNFSRYSLRANIDHQVSSGVKVGASIFGSQSINKGLFASSQTTTFSNAASASAGLLSQVIAAPPTLVPYRADGSFFPFLEQRNSIYGEVSNPLGLVNILQENSTRRTIANVYVDATVLKNLTYRASFSADLSNGLGDFYSPRFILPATVLATSGGGNASKSNSYGQTLLHESILTYTQPIGEAHLLKFTGVFGTQKQTFETNTATANLFPNDVLQNNALQAGTTQAVSSGANSDRLDSYMARVNYSFQDRYYLDVTMRADGSSKFGTNYKYGFFPAVGASWRVIEEPFVKKLSWLSDLKLRGSWGVTGNAAAISPYRSLATFEALIAYQFNNNPVVGIRPTGIANPNLRWERSTQTNLGLDIAFFSNRLSLTADYYVKRTDDLLFNKVLPQSSGYGSINGNFGAIENRGLEIALNARLSNKSFSWELSPNLTINRNKVLRIDGATQEIQVGGVGRVIVGQPIGVFKTFVWDGIYQTGDAFLPGDNGRLGGARVRDITGDGRITADDQVITGNPHPNFIYGVTSMMRFKGFDLSFFVQGTQGNNVYNFLRTHFENPLGQRNQLAGMANRWSSTNPSNEYVSGFQGGRVPVTDRFSEDGSFARLRSLTLGYTFPKVKFLTNARLYVSGTNLLTITRYSGYDPEVNSFGGSNTVLGADNGTFPTAKSLLAGLQLTF